MAVRCCLLAPSARRERLSDEQRRRLLAMAAESDLGFFRWACAAAAQWSWQSLRRVDESYQITNRSWKAAHATLDKVHSVVIGKDTADDETADLSEHSNFSIDSDSSGGEPEEEDTTMDMRAGARKHGGYAAVEATEA